MRPRDSNALATDGSTYVATINEFVNSQSLQTLHAAFFPANFGDAIVGLGQTLAAAQEVLDKASFRYSVDVTNPLRMPTTYRIPKMTVGLRFSSDTISKRGFNILIASASKEQRDSNQQTIDLEFVAAPATPDFIGDIPQVSLLLVGALRQQILDALKRSTSPFNSTTDSAGIFFQRAALILGPPRPDGSSIRDVLVLLHAKVDQTEEIGAWYTAIEESQKPPVKILEILDFRWWGDLKLNLLANFAEPLCALQESFSKKAGTVP